MDHGFKKAYPGKYCIGWYTTKFGELALKESYDTK